MDFNGIRRIATLHAFRLGMSSADAEDCACTLVLRFLGDRRMWDAEPDEAWIHRCARNHALNYKRGLLRRQRRFIPWYEPSDELLESAPTYDSPLACHLRREAMQEVYAVIRVLPEQTVHLFVGHHLEGQALDQLAQRIGMKPNAVSQTLFRARARVRRQLERRGWTHDEIERAIRINGP